MVAKRQSVRWDWVTVFLMFLGYSGYYLCRSNFSVAKPFLLAEYPGVITKDVLGSIASISILFYAGGKFLFGSLADLFRGKRLFLFGMIGAIICTVLVGVGGPPVFLLAVCSNRLVQSSGWVGMVKITSRWFGGNHYGRAMAFISLSFLFGDFASRQFIGALFEAKLPWQTVFYICAGVLALILIPTAFFLRDTPGERGLEEPASSEKALVADVVAERPNAWAVMRPLITNGTFITVCILSFGFTFMRETFNEWIPTFLTEAAKMPKEQAGQASSYFPLFGGLSVIACGFLSDRFRTMGSALLLTGGLILGTVGLYGLSVLQSNDPNVYVMTTAAIGFVLIGPYSLLAGTISLDFGGKAASSTAAGWIDGVGYIGGILSGKLIADVATKQGWSAAFQLLAVVAGLSAVVAVFYALAERRRATARPV